MNCIQYTAEAFKDKNGAISLAKRANLQNNVEVYYKENPTFQEVLDLLNTGHLIRRAGDTTTFAWVDCDNTDNANIPMAAVSEALRGYKNIEVVMSSSGNKYKYHILQSIPETPRDKLKQACDNLRKLVSKAIPELTDFDTMCDNFTWNLFGTPQHGKLSKMRLRDSIRISKFTNEDVTANIRENTCSIPPYSSSELAKRLNVPMLNERGYRCDVTVPIRTHGHFLVIPEKKRYKWGMAMAKKLLLRSFHLDCNCNYTMTKADYLWWVGYTVKECCRDGNNLDTIVRDIKGFAEKLYNGYKDYSFERLYQEFSHLFSSKEMPNRPYRSRMYLPMLVSDLIHDDWIDDPEIKVDVANRTVLFKDRQRLMDIASLYDYSYRSFVNAAFKYGWTISWKKESPIDTLEQDDNGNILVPYGTLTPRLKMYLYRHKLPYIIVPKNPPIQPSNTWTLSNTKLVTSLQKDITLRSREETCYLSAKVLLPLEKVANLSKNNGKEGVTKVQKVSTRERKLKLREAKIHRHFRRYGEVTEADRKFMYRHREMFKDIDFKKLKIQR